MSHAGSQTSGRLFCWIRSVPSEVSRGLPAQRGGSCRSSRALPPLGPTSPSIELEIDHCGVDPNRHHFDIWITYWDEGRSPSEETTRWETLYEETRFPACSPALLEIRGRPRYSLELRYWPLLHHLARPGDWTRWFASQGDPPPDLSSASGFRLYSMLVQAAVEGMGVAIGHPAVIARELSQGTLVPLFDRHNEVRTRRLVLH